MAEFRIYLDGTLYTNSLDISEFPIEYDRGVVSKTMVSKFSENVTIVNDGYGYIKGLLDAGSECSEVDVLIEARCEGENNYSTLIEGVILLKEVEVIDKYCVINCSVEQNNVFDIFIANKSKDVDLDASYSLNGTVSLTAIRQVLNNFFNSDGSGIAATAGSYSYGYEFYKVLKHILRYISDGRIDLVSNFLTTSVQNRTYNVEFTTTPVNNETVTFVVTNQYGYIDTFEITSNGNATDFINRVKAAFFTYGFFSFEKVDGSTGGGLISIDIEAYNLNNTLADVTTSGATSITTTPGNSYITGAKNIYISDANHLTNVLTEPFTLSFDRVMEIFQQNLFDLGIAFEKTGAQWYMRVEPVEYFFSNAVSINIPNVDEVKITYDPDRLVSGVKLGFARAAGFETFLFESFSSCTNVMDKVVKKDVLFDDEIANQINGTQDYGDDLFIIHCYQNGATIDPIKYELEIAATLSPITFQSTYYYNDFVRPKKLLKHHLFFLPDKVKVSNTSQTLTTVNAGGTFTDTSSGDALYVGYSRQFYKFAEFEHPIGFNDFRNISEYSIIEFEHKGVTYSCYILNLIHEIYTQSTELQLLIKSEA